VTKRGPSESSIVPNTRNSNTITKPSAVSRTSSTTPSRPRTQNSVGRASAAAASTTSSRTRPVSSAGRASSSTVSTSVTASRPKTTPGATKYSHNYNRKPTTPTSSCSTKSSQKQISGHNSTKSQPKTISKPTSTTISSKETKSSHKKLPESNLKTFQPTSKEISSKQLQQSNTEPLKTRTLGANVNRTTKVKMETSLLDTGDQLLTFSDLINARSDYDQLQRLLENSLDEQDKQCLGDLRKYVLTKEDSWILDAKLLNFIGALLEHRSLNSDIRAKLMRLLAAAALRDDFWSFLQMDRRDRHLMKYPNDFDELTVEEQKAVALFLCNNFSSSKGSEWLFYTSPWQLEDKKEVSNIRITSKVASFSLVSYTPSLQDYGSAIIYNIAMKEAKALSVPSARYNSVDLPHTDLDYGSVSDQAIMTNSINGSTSDTTFVTLKVYNDIAAELSIAILKFIKRTKTPDEEILFRCVKSLMKFSMILKQELMSCIAMVQVDLDALVPGHSPRCDHLWSKLKIQLLSAQ